MLTQKPAFSVPGPLMRVASHIRSNALDRALVAGVDPASSRQLAARASTLTSRRFRNAAADGLQRWLGEPPGGSHGARVLPSPRLAAENEQQVRELASLLREEAPLHVAGVARVAQLLTDGLGPAYGADPALLAASLRDARTALAAGTPITSSSAPPPRAASMPLPRAA